MASITFDEALLILDKTGPVLRIWPGEVSDILESNHLSGAIIGGVAVGLHGHKRSTVDVDVFIPDDADGFAALLRSRRFRYDAKAVEFVKDRVPVHLVTPEQAGQNKVRSSVIGGIRTVTLADLINIKLRSGLSNVLRAKDLGDVIDLIRANRLTVHSQLKLDKPLRTDFRKLVRAIQNDTTNGS